MESNFRRFVFYLSRENRTRRRLSPAQIVALSFALAILLGTAALSLPVAHAPGREIGLLDALFTATSAICVTGLVVMDTGSDFSRLGQVVILLLIQIGGFGIISVGTFIAFFSGRRIGFKERLNLQAQINSFHVGGVVKLIKRIMYLVLGAELVGTLLLYYRFRIVEGTEEGAFYALFHSISAFNNAGFSLYSDSLMGFVADPWINGVVMSLVIFGGLGFVVIVDILSHFRARHGRKPLALHTKMVVTATGFLILFGAIVIAVFEWDNPGTLGALSVPVRVQASFFQAITPRTAGFNTVDYAEMRSGTKIFTMLLMFIGGSPGSTAGGIKTVTFFVLLGSAWSISRGHGELVIFGRRLALETVVKAGSIALISMIVLGAATTLLTFTEPEFSALAIGFETVSAFGIVGLSTGITPSLSPAGKLIIILLMYFGRIGPLTLALALVEKSPEKRINYPAEDIVIG
jgi:trk system potassium uptake protein